jgi:hypothetical protein
VPFTSVLVKDGKPYVWKIDGSAGKVRLQSVTIEGMLTEGTPVRVTDGVEPGDHIAVAGVHKLTDGQAVRIDEGVNQ